MDSKSVPTGPRGRGSSHRKVLTSANNHCKNPAATEKNQTAITRLDRSLLGVLLSCSQKERGEKLDRGSQRSHSYTYPRAPIR